MQDDPNPYQSPVSPPTERTAAPAVTGFRWRIIPTTLLLIWGGIGAAGMLLHLGYCAWRRFTRPDLTQLGIGPTPQMMVGGVVGLGGMGLLLVAGVALWKGRWWTAAWAFGAGLLLAWLGSALGGPS